MNELQKSIKKSLDNAYEPIFFEGESIVKAITAGENAAAFPIAERMDATGLPTFNSTASVLEFTSLLEKVMEKVFRFKELRQVITKYNAFLSDIENDYKAYTVKHEDYLQASSGAVETINNKKVLMKNYLLEELHASLQKCGMDGEFHDMATDRLDLRNWPVKKKFDICSEKHLEVKEMLSLGDLGAFGGMIAGAGAYGSAVAAIAIGNSFNPMVLAILPGLILYMRGKIKRIKSEMDVLEPMVQANNADMKADLEQLDLFYRALDNIANIYSDILTTVRPVMKAILQELELKHGCDVDELPCDQEEALFYISRLLKGLAEKRIVPCDETDTSTIHQSVCRYSNEMSAEYNKIKAELVKFC